MEYQITASMTVGHAAAYCPLQQITWSCKPTASVPIYCRIGNCRLLNLAPPNLRSEARLDGRRRCRMTNYELLRWLVETPSRGIRHYRMLSYYYGYSITHTLFHSRLKSLLFCKSSLPQPFLFLFQDSLYGFPRLFTVTSEHIRLFTF